MIRLTCANAFGTNDVYRVAPDEDCKSNRLGGPFRNSVHSVTVGISINRRSSIRGASSANSTK